MKTTFALMLIAMMGLNGIDTTVAWGKTVDRDPPITNEGGSRFRQSLE